MAAPGIGTRVAEGSRRGVVVDHRPQGMVDVCFDDSGLVERRKGSNLVRLNPAAKQAPARPSGRGKTVPLFAPPPDLYDPTQEQFRAVVQGVYESLVVKELGVSAFKDGRGGRADTKAIRAGKLSQEGVRRLLSRAYAIATTQGQKHGYLEAGSQRPTMKGAALAAARYGADPRFVLRMLGDDDRAKKLAAAKGAEGREANRQDYEITLQLSRKGQSPREVEELVGGKVTTQSYPARPPSLRRKNVLDWHERGMSRSLPNFDLRLLPLLEAGRKLGKIKGQQLRSFAQARKEKAKTAGRKGLEDTEYAFRELTRSALDLLGEDALTDAGLVKPEVRRDLGVMRRTYEDIADDVASGRPVRNPIKSRIKQIAKVGTPSPWGGSTTRREVTETRVAAMLPSLDPNGIGYYIITFNPQRGDVKEVLGQVGGWRFDRTITGTAYETGLVSAKDAPKLHQVVWYEKGGAGKRGVGGQFAKGYYGVIGPRAKSDKSQFATKAEAFAHARILDQRAVSFLVEQVHAVYKIGTGEGAVFEVRGPRAEDELHKRGKYLEAKEARGEDIDESYDLWTRLQFLDEASAWNAAAQLDRTEAGRGTLGIVGYRTAERLTGAKASEKLNATIVALEARRVHVTMDPSVGALSEKSGTRRFERVTFTKEEALAADKKWKEDVANLATYYRKKKRLSALDAHELAKSEVPHPAPSRLARVLPDATTSAATQRFAKRSVERLRGDAAGRGVTAEELEAIEGAGEKRGTKKLVAAILKPVNAEATKRVETYAIKKWGPTKFAAVLSEPRAKIKMRIRMPGGFDVPGRAFAPDYKRGIERDATLYEHLTAKLWPKGNIPANLLPKYDRKELLEMDEDDLRALAKSVGISDAEATKLLTSAERGALAKVMAERPAASGMELIRRGGGLGAEPPPRPKRAPRAVGAPPKAPPVPTQKMSLAEIDARLAELNKQLAQMDRKKNGLLSSGLSLAVRGGRYAASYGTKAYNAARVWVTSPAGRRFSAEVAGIATAMFGARAVKSGKITPEQAALVQSELARKTGRTPDPARVAAALQLSGA